MRMARMAAAAAAVAALAACGETLGPPAEPVAAAPPAAAEGVYTVQLEVDPGMTREEVESALLYRAAQVAAERGSPYFALVEAEAPGARADTVYASYGRSGVIGTRLGAGDRFRFPYYIGWANGWAVGRVPPVGPIGPLGIPDPGAYVVDPDALEPGPFDVSATIELLEARPAEREDVLETARALSAFEALPDA